VKMPKGHMKKMGKIKEKQIVKRRVRTESEDNDTITRVEAISMHRHTSCTFRGMDLFSVVEKVMSEMTDLRIEDVNDKDTIKFDNTQTLEETILNSIVHYVRVKLKGAVEYEYFPGLCEVCSAFPLPSRPHIRCAGCQLVSYCSKKCIKDDKSNHRDICKFFSVKNGKNIFTIGQEKRENRSNWTAYLTDLCNKAKAISNQNYDIEKRMFFGPRMCPICLETRSHMLKDCSCCCVAYCGEEHRLKDNNHLASCKEMMLCAKVYAYRQHHQVDMVPVPSNIERIYNPLPPMNICTEPTWSQGNVTDRGFTEKTAILAERLSHPLTILHQLEKNGVGSRRTPLSEVTSLDIHICCNFAMLDAEVWEYAMHRLPALTRLSITYLGEKNLPVRTKNHHQTCRRLKRCQDCESLGRYITFAVYPMHYHMFFSSDDYKKPDVVAVFSGKNCLSVDEPEEEVHTITSYRNMTYSKDTIVIMTDYLEADLNRSLSVLCDAREDVLVETPTQMNPYYGFKDKRAHNSDNKIYISNDRHYVAALRRGDDNQKANDSDDTDSDYDLE
ncbi:unnamed protein product, partial [Meganyctiphanes norvegica]